MNNTPLFDAVASNNNGAQLIDEGDYTGALSFLSSSLKATKNCMADSCTGGGDQEVPFDLDCLMLKQRGALQESRNDDGYFVYDRPIQVPVVFFNSSSFPHKVMCSAISIFNLALAHHLHALKTSQKAELFLRKAGRLYEFAMQVQPVAATETAPCTFFHLAILNNLADVHRRLGDSRTSQKFCEELLHLLMSLADARKETPADEDDTLDVFYQNSFFYLLAARSINAAPAA